MNRLYLALILGLGSLGFSGCGAPRYQGPPPADAPSGPAEPKEANENEQ